MTINDKNKMHSALFFLKKSGNEKNTVSRIGAKIKRPTPGANSIPNAPVKLCIMPDPPGRKERRSAPTEEVMSALVPIASTTSSDGIYFKENTILSTT